jgi:hypothetical protein
MTSKIYTTLVILFTCFTLYGQVPVFKATRSQQWSSSGKSNERKAANDILSKNFRKFDVYNINAHDIFAYVKQSNDKANFILQMGGEYNWHLDIAPENLYGENYKNYVITETGTKEYRSLQNVIYKGTILNSPEGRARLTIENDKLTGYFMIGEKKIFVESLKNLVKDSDESEYIMYSAADVIDEGTLDCQAEKANHAKNDFSNGRIKATCSGTWQVQVATFATFSRFSSAGGINEVNNEIMTILNNVQGNYDLLKVKLVVTQQRVASCSTCDPWTPTNDPNTLLTNFTNWGPTGFTAEHDEGLLFYDGAGSGVVGKAWVGALCTNNRYAVNDKMSSASANRVLVAHEMGHNFGASHDASGAPYIMAPSVNNATTWSSTSVNSINSHLSSRTCITCDQGTNPGGCSQPSGLSTSNVSTTSATLNWSTASGANSYRVRYRSSDSTSWQEVTTSSSSYNLSGLANNTTYEWQVRSECSSLNSAYSSGPNFATSSTPPPTTCVKPTSLIVESLEQTTVTLRWSAISDATGYTVQIRVAGNTSWSNFEMSSNFVNFNGLTANTSYEWRVRTNCSSGSSEYTTGKTFTTLGGANPPPNPNPQYELPWLEDFSLVDNTTSDTGNTAWTSTLLSSNGGSAAVKTGVFRVNAASTLLELEKIYFGSATGISFTVNIKSSTTVETTDYVQLEYRWNDGEWNTVSKYGGYRNGNIGLNFTGNQTSVQVRLLISADQSDDVYSIDNIQFTCSANCPSGATASAEFTENLDHVVNISDKGSLAYINAYPNPFNHEFTLQVDQKMGDGVEIIVYNMSGQMVERKKHHFTESAAVLGKSLRQGIYFVKVIGTQGTKIIKIVKEQE